MAIEISPDFLSTNNGTIFFLETASESSWNKNLVILIPPFAEEMNKSRKIFSSFQHHLSSNKYRTVLFDLFGTGDSQGEFSDATWLLWQQNLIDIIKYVFEQYPEVRINFVALRTGALLLNNSLHQLPKYLSSAIHQIHYWNPVFNATQFVNQFLRLKLTGDIMRENGEKLTTKTLRQQLLKQGTMEVAGYQLSAELVEEFEQADASLPKLDNLHIIHFYEISSSAKITSALSNYISKLQEHHYQIETHSLTGPKFWVSQEICISQPLIDLTTSHMGNSS